MKSEKYILKVVFLRVLCFFFFFPFMCSLYFLHVLISKSEKIGLFLKRNHLDLRELMCFDMYRNIHLNDFFSKNCCKIYIT